MPELVLTIGLPGSGKSTWAREQVERRPEFIVIERDIIREELTGDHQNFTLEPRVTSIAQERAIYALRHGRSVIIADTNLRPKYRKVWKKIADSHGAWYREHFFDTPIEVCIERDALRPKPVGEEVIRRMNSSLMSQTD